ncbi:MAG: PhzF family phenazine biosynthesis protein [Bacteriovorax sp.]|nr:PhzF family phenazine biosynthesis protein [Bacteriovorax sp.]
MKIKIFAVNAFVGENCRGNLAGVCIPPQDISDEELQKLATEFNASETGFIFPQEKNFLIRWFSPTQEVDLCGHATLACASWIWSNGYSQTDEIIFKSRSGQLRCVKAADQMIEMEFPELPVSQAESEKGLLEALAIDNTVFVGKSENYFLIEVKDEEVLQALSPNFQLMSELKTLGVFVTCKSSKLKYDFVSRCFFPKEGIPEDPATGSAHCSLGPYWRDKLLKNTLCAWQSSKLGGEIKIIFRDSKLILSGRTTFE